MSGIRATSRVTIEEDGRYGRFVLITSPLESVRRAIAFADEMIALGAEVDVVGDLALTLRWPERKEARDGNGDSTA